MAEDRGSPWRRAAVWSAVRIAVLIGGGLPAWAQAQAVDGAPACKPVDAPTVRADPQACRRRYLLQGVRESDLQSLYRAADAKRSGGDFDGAADALDCAEAVAGADAGWPADYELVRRRGVLDYYRECTVEALTRFRRALQLAQRHEDRAAEAKSWNNVGSALRRLGDYRSALQAFLSSLQVQRNAREPAPGPVLNNIADIYRDLGDTANAQRHYQQALGEFRRIGNRIEAAHVLQSQGALALEAGDPAGAERLLEQALAGYVEAGERTYQLRLYAELARVALAGDDAAKARRWSERGLALAAADGTRPPAPLQLQAARAARSLGEPRAALTRVKDALAQLPAQDSDRPALLAELAADHEALGEWPQALTALRESETAARHLREARYDREMKWMQLRFETAERDRTIAALAAENRLRAASLRQRTLALWLTAVSAVAVVLGLIVFFLRRQQRARLAEAARQARLAEEVDYYRRAAADLGVDRTRLQAALDSREDAVLILDAGGQVVAANRSAGRLLGETGGGASTLPGRSFGELLDEPAAGALAQALARLEESSTPQRFEFRPRDGERLQARLSETGQGEGSVVLGLDPLAPSAEAAVAEPVPGPAPIPVEPVEVEHEVGDEEMRSSFRRALVELMLAVVEAWERSTGQGRLELAEKSRIWRVTVDDGRLRARAMERYLSLAKLPRQPRWRDVLRSGYYVLAECPLEEAVRSELQRHVDAVLTYTRRHALV
ncbi:tetratricopeptide repeat protein [Lysobacter sp. BMK333-48F3]|uniref:tetratricopeptide repeat protein n=1 Tax=Lysobacter sp. BMK333-48F3 TaxID=2867962 RepID=UPI001C8CC0A7|nr:tetratricopeptide repeat protein [Lysobacter sp. BMK333-48F3]